MINAKLKYNTMRFRGFPAVFIIYKRIAIIKRARIEHCHWSVKTISFG